MAVQRVCANCSMNKPVIPVEIRTVLPFNSGRAVFIGNEEKVFVIYVDESVGTAIAMFLNDTPKERPLTHDLIGHLMTALGAKVDRVIINDLKSETYFARLIISAENELFEKKIIELDGRPSDCIALAIQQPMGALQPAVRDGHFSPECRRIPRQRGDHYASRSDHGGNR